MLLQIPRLRRGLEQWKASEVQSLCPRAPRLRFDRRLGVGLPHATTANLKTENHVDNSFPGEIACGCMMRSDQRLIAKAIKQPRASAACKQDMKKQRCLRVAAVESSWQ